MEPINQNNVSRKTAVEKSFDAQMMLKDNSEYEKWCNSTAIQLIEYFFSKYKDTKIEVPKLREKSPRSLLGKIKNLQIERLSKLYAIGEITRQNNRDFYYLIKERIEENKDLDETKILNEVKKLLAKKEINIKDFEDTFMIDGISNSTKTALLRILVSKIEKSDLKNKHKKLQYLSDKYGKGLATKLNEPEADIIRYDSILNIKKSKEKIERLKDENQFLKANDLRGMKIVVVEVPDDLETDNEEIKRLLQLRKNAKTKAEERLYTHMAIVEMGKEFYQDIMTNEELLNKTNMSVIPGSSRHRRKSNGYEAEHIKYINNNNPDFTLEMQFKSIYVENLTRGTGSASHENRPGKTRVLPNANDDNHLIEQINYMAPKYTTFGMKDGHIVAQKQTMLRNVMAYFQDQLDVGSEEYEKIISLYSDYENKIKNSKKDEEEISK